MKTKYIYPAQFVNEDNGTISVFFPDMRHCFTGGWSNIHEAYGMAQEVLEGHIETLIEEKINMPPPSDIENITVENGIVLLVSVNVEDFKILTKPVKKTLSIPYWLNVEAEKRHINFSGVLQEALKERLGI